MVDSLQIGAAVIVVFVLALTTEILFAFCRVYAWFKRQIWGPDLTVVPPGRYRRGSVSHSWSEARVENSPTATGFGHDRVFTPADELLAHADRETRTLAPPPGAPWSNGARDGSPGHTVITQINSADHTDSLQVEDLRDRRRSPTPRQHRLLFSSDFTQSLQQDWRSGQFSCANCSLSLTGQRYILREDQPHCKKCYDELFANICETCHVAITTDFKDLSYKGRHWHDKCFKCSSCPNSLVNESFAFKNEQLYCATCYEHLFAPRCARCTNVFRAGMKKYEHRGRQWHAECFVCKICATQIGSSPFIPRGNDVLCVSCYERQYSQACTKCGLPVGKGSIMYKNCPWHRDCFCCTTCQRVIGRERFTTVNDQPYCVQCYGQQFAKKCSTCTKPITGVDGSKFIAFEGRQWHADCFLCYKCRTQLYGRGFLTDGDDVLCPDCCKED